MKLCGLAFITSRVRLQFINVFIIINLLQAAARERKAAMVRLVDAGLGPRNRACGL